MPAPNAMDTRPVRNAIVVRVLKLLRWLEEGRPLSLEQIAARFNTCQRTARRDIAVLEEVGCNIQKEIHQDHLSRGNPDRVRWVIR